MLCGTGFTRRAQLCARRCTLSGRDSATDACGIDAQPRIFASPTPGGPSYDEAALGICVCAGVCVRGLGEPTTCEVVVRACTGLHQAAPRKLLFRLRRQEKPVVLPIVLYVCLLNLACLPLPPSSLRPLTSSFTRAARLQPPPPPVSRRTPTQSQSPHPTSHDKAPTTLTRKARRKNRKPGAPARLAIQLVVRRFRQPRRPQRGSSHAWGLGNPCPGQPSPACHSQAPPQRRVGLPHLQARHHRPQRPRGRPLGDDLRLRRRSRPVGATAAAHMHAACEATIIKSVAPTVYKLLSKYRRCAQACMSGAHSHFHP